MISKAIGFVHVGDTYLEDGASMTVNADGMPDWLLSPQLSWQQSPQ